jgi:hypothetical protein
MGEPGHDPESPLEAEGIPDMQDGTPQQQWASDPQEQPVPGDQPVATETYGTTAEEQHEGEPLEGRLAREEWEVSEAAAAESGGTRVVEPDAGAAPDTEKEMIGEDVGPDSGGYSPEERAVRIESEDDQGESGP